MRYHWPGNVRELKSALEYAFVIAEEGLIDTDQLPPQIIRGKSAPNGEALMPSGRDQIEKAELIEALRQCSGNQSETARLLGLCRTTVWNRMKKHQIDLRKIAVS